MIIVEFISAILPAILLWLYVWKKDAKPEPTIQLVKAIMWGIGICIPVILIEIQISNILFGIGSEPATLPGVTAQAFFVAALPEEAFKLLALWIVLRKNPYYDEHYDGIVYAVCIGLAFATVENIGYVFHSEVWPAIAITRALLAVPGHYAFAVIMGYYYSVYHFVNHSDNIKVKILLIPFLSHGIYDTLAMSFSVNPFIGVLTFIILIYFCVKMHKAAKTRLFSLIGK